MSEIIKSRYDFLLLFDVKDGNPNGDPDAGNLPRVDAETGMGLVTDVCIKRKVRNYVQLTKNNERPFDIYVKERAILGTFHTEAFAELGINLGEELTIEFNDNLLDEMKQLQGLIDNISIGYENENNILTFDINSDKDQIKKVVSDKENEFSKDAKNLILDAIKGLKTRKITSKESDNGKKLMCERFYDIRAFGAVMSLKSAPNCGQVRGPIQLTFARSIDPIITSEHCITRMAVATEKEAKDQNGENRTMGRKYTVPYGLYCTKGFISAHLANLTGFDDNDLALFWEALKNMFDHDHSAARGMMCTCKLIVFKHSTALGNAPAHKLFDTIKINRINESKPARSFSDYSITIDKDSIPDGVELIEMI